LADAPPVALALLAAGRSLRFGKADKLRAPLRGKPLGLHAAETLARLPARTRIVIAARQNHACSSGWQDAGFAVVRNPSASEGMGTSVAAAARIARRGGCEVLLIALADMPLVPLSHFKALIEAARVRGRGAMIASVGDGARMPPAAFGSDHFDALAELTGDEGARALLADAETIACPPTWLADVDTPEALAALEGVGAPPPEG
jgi:CTP:molybdopterin cytidylyltransferase MocA